MELLTNSGWSPANTVEAIFVSVRAELLEGGARIDFMNKRDYTEAEAQQAFQRMVASHGTLDLSDTRLGLNVQIALHVKIL